MRYWKTCYITCFIFVLIPLTLYGQEDIEQLQKLDKLMFSVCCCIDNTKKNCIKKYQRQRRSLLI